MKVKQLVWEHWIAKTIVGNYEIIHNYELTDKTRYDLIYFESDCTVAFKTIKAKIISTCDKYKEAESIAQKHYEALILSGLETEDES